MTPGAEQLQRDLDGALMMAMVLLDAPLGHRGDQAMVLGIIDAIRPHLTYRSHLTTEMVFALGRYRAALEDQSVAAALRNLHARHGLKLVVHSIMRRRLGASIERIEAAGIAIRAAPMAETDPESPGPEVAA